MRFSFSPKYQAGILAISWLGLSLPFVNRPLFVDDHAHFAEAMNLKEHWSRPYRSEGGLGWRPEKGPDEANPLGYFYLVAAITSLIGEQIWKIHLVMMAFNLAALLCFYSLARRYLAHPFWAAWLWMVSPHFWLTANALLVDTLLAPVMLLGLWMWICAWERNNNRLLAAAGIVLGLAPLVKYTGLLVWLAVIAWTWLETPHDRARRWFYALLPCAVLVLWMAWTRFLYPQSHLSAVAASSMTWPRWQTLVSLLGFLSALVPVTIILAAVSLLKNEDRVRVRAAVLLASGLAIGLSLGYLPLIGLQAGIWLGLTLLWFGVVPWRYLWQRTGGIWLTAWSFAGVIGLAIARDWVCARYLVILSPPWVLLTVMALERIDVFGKRFFRLTTMAAATAFGLVLAIADYQQAAVDWSVSQSLRAWQPPGLVDVGYYPAAALGGLSLALDPKAWKPLDPAAFVPSGALALVPRRTLPLYFHPKLRAPQRLALWSYRSMLPFRTLDMVSGSGFYGTIWGPLPFGFTTAPLEIYSLVREKA